MRTMRLAAAGVALHLALGGVAFAQNSPTPWEILRPTSPLPPVEETGLQDVGDVDLYYAIYGRGEPLILLHSALGNGDDWGSQIGPLSQRYQVIVLDMRGHGRSSASEKPLSYRLMAEDVLRFIKTRNLKEPVIVGWGDGATVGLELALRYPKRVGGLVAFGMAFDRKGLQPRPQDSATFAEYVRRAEADHIRLSGDPKAFLAMVDQLDILWAGEPSYSPDELAEMKIPTTIISAEHDEWVKPEHMDEAALLIPNARLVMMSGTGHFAPWQTPKKFNNVLRLVLSD